MSVTGVLSLSEEQFDALAAPLIVAHGLASLEAQLDVLQDVDDELREALSGWEEPLRGRAIDQLRASIHQVRRVLDALEASIP